jgi:hypothetical protein
LRKEQTETRKKGRKYRRKEEGSIRGKNREENRLSRQNN